jgi:hypothetical protein
MEGMATGQGTDFALSKLKPTKFGIPKPISIPSGDKKYNPKLIPNWDGIQVSLLRIFPT